MKCLSRNCDKEHIPLEETCLIHTLLLIKYWQAHPIEGTIPPENRISARWVEEMIEHVKSYLRKYPEEALEI